MKEGPAKTLRIAPPKATMKPITARARQVSNAAWQKFARRAQGQAFARIRPTMLAVVHSFQAHALVILEYRCVSAAKIEESKLIIPSAA